MGRDAVHQDWERVRLTFARLLDEASDADLRRRSNGTRWTNRQLLFHMLLGFLIMRALLNLVRLLGRLPPGVSRGYARLLNAGTRPFDVVNYLGSWFAGNTLSRRAMKHLCDHTIARLHQRFDAESDTDLARGMYYPDRWDPFFTTYMTLADVYRFPAQHFDFHRQQLTLSRAEP
ncbi:DinB family protein [Amycolatopsis japonica]|uniref:DinB family protein n=1 Tax=Amycolatopsis japonica TaxID=208439 RepID=UPI00380B430C